MLIIRGQYATFFLEMFGRNLPSTFSEAKMTPLVGDLPSLATKKQTPIKIGLKLRHSGENWFF
jgi:hypothetical protein